MNVHVASTKSRQCSRNFATSDLLVLYNSCQFKDKLIVYIIEISVTNGNQNARNGTKAN